jgi:hypothetical protein
VSIKLSEDELFAITSYKVSTMQLAVLHRRGFHRAFIGRQGVVLERSHYEAVTRGETSTNAPSPGGKKSINLSHLKLAT